jgi:hypothetical protein
VSWLAPTTSAKAAAVARTTSREVAPLPPRTRRSVAVPAWTASLKPAGMTIAAPI